MNCLAFTIFVKYEDYLYSSVASIRKCDNLDLTNGHDICFKITTPISNRNKKIRYLFIMII